MVSKYDAVVMGLSAGGIYALKQIIPMLPEDFKVPVIIVQHIAPVSYDFMPRLMNDIAKIPVKYAFDKEKIQSGNIYFAPPGYHLLVEEGGAFALSIDEPVNYSRPSIDVLFETAAEVYRERLISIILTGASADGSQGLKKVKMLGGLTIVEDPGTAEVNIMPKSAIAAVDVDHIMPLTDIGLFLSNRFHV